MPYRKQGYWYHTRFETGPGAPDLRAAPGFAGRARRDPAGRQCARRPVMSITGSVRSKSRPNSRGSPSAKTRSAGAHTRCASRICVTGEILVRCHCGRRVGLGVGQRQSDRSVRREGSRDAARPVRQKTRARNRPPARCRSHSSKPTRAFTPASSKSKSERFIFIHMESTVSSEWRYAHADDPELAFTDLSAARARSRVPTRASWRRLHHQDQLAGAQFSPDAGADRPGSRPRRIGRTSSRTATIRSSRISTFSAGFLALSVRTGGLAKISIRPWLDGSPRTRCEIFHRQRRGRLRHVDVGQSGARHRPLRYAYSSLTTPTTIYDYNVRTGEKILLKRDPVLGGFDPANYRTEFLFAPARDGAQIPVSLVYRAGSGARRVGAAAAIRVWSVRPVHRSGFSSARLSLIDRGFVYAIAHVRGGQEMGRAWYDDGRTLHKMNSFTDFIDVTRHLVAQRYAAKDKVFAMGGSAGGLVDGRGRQFEPRRLPRHRRAGALRRCRHHHAGRQHSAHHQRVRRVGQSRTSA